MSRTNEQIITDRLAQGCTLALVVFGVLAALVVATAVHFTVKFW